ncbi:MAG: deoxyribonuclease IV [Bacilli bacterium]|nr:deoxyribonuclease IV [Bacilli bacterium]
MLIIGSHVGFNKNDQLLGSLNEALSYGANTFMFYTGAPQNTNRGPIIDGYTLQAMEIMKEKQIDYSKVIVHAPYIINLANGDVEKFSFSVRFLKEEVIRCEMLGIKYMVLHPGSHVGQGVDTGINNIIRGLNEVLENSSVTILLETMAGKGTEIGRDFTEIKQIISGIEKKDLIGVCMDTCHLNDAGYDVSKFDEILDIFDKEIGLSYLKCIHVNDSKNVLGAHKDRHENIGFGEIGFDSLINIIYNPRLENVPKILETPYVNEKAPYKHEIEMIRNKKFDSELKEKISN